MKYYDPELLKKSIHSRILYNLGRMETWLEESFLKIFPLSGLEFLLWLHWNNVTKVLRKESYFLFMALLSIIQNGFPSPTDQSFDDYVSYKSLWTNELMLWYHGSILLVLETNTGEINFGYKPSQHVWFFIDLSPL
jgi:hypothetical protein